jgi:hypothetical protein
MKKRNKFIAAILIILLSGFFIKARDEKKEQQTTPIHIALDTDKNVADNYEIKAVKIPSNIAFANERVPIEKQDVLERMDRELLVNTYWQSNALLYIKRANKYFPVIEPILKRNGIPDDFKYLALIESGLTNATSPSGAKGFWQIMKTTGREYGLEINSNVDERFNLEKATEVACKYLNNAYSKFHSWTLVAASYNAGRSGIIKQLDRQQVTDYYDLLLGEETSRYVFRIIAAKEILKHPTKYGFVFDKSDLYRYTPTYTVKVDSVITNVGNFAKRYGMTYKEFKILNPWLRENKLNNASKKVYGIKLPAYE